ncbi:uncharacterized protein ACNLHF_012547 [Anomaloglossus baeobatrachus]|uniref:uncharacterized protein LOC142296308 n=1 Tax=Anomaloglossus baeobatrachus TaxID=238106 RepID=UPI003F50A64B
MAPRVDTGRIIAVVEGHPDLWDTRTNGYRDRTIVERTWKSVAAELYPNNGWDRCSPGKRARFVELVRRRWRSARDQYRREFNPIPSTSANTRKRRYVYFEQLEFLRPIMEVTQTDDNLDDSDENPSAAQSAPATSASEVEQTNTNNPESQNSGNQNTENISSEAGPQSTTNQATNTPQDTTTNIPPSSIQISGSRIQTSTYRARRLRRPKDFRSLPEIIDTRVMSIMNSLLPENDTERFCRSLAPYLSKVHSDNQERLRAAILTLISACQTNPLPNHVLLAIEQWRTNYNSHIPDVSAQLIPQTQSNQPTTSLISNFGNQAAQNTEVQNIINRPIPSISTLMSGQSSNMLTQLTQPTNPIVPINYLQHPLQTQNYRNTTNIQPTQIQSQIPSYQQSLFFGQTPTHSFIQGQQFPSNISYTQQPHIQNPIMFSQNLAQPMYASSSHMLPTSSSQDSNVATCVNKTQTSTYVSQTISDPENNIPSTQQSVATLEDLIE